MYKIGEAIWQKKLIRNKALDLYYISMFLHLSMKIAYFVGDFFWTDYLVYICFYSIPNQFFFISMGIM